MPDREFIHTSADVVDVLKYASDSQFQIIDDTPQAEPRPKTVLPRDIPKIKDGTFYLIRPEWMNGPFQTMVISEGYHRGKYFVQPRVNWTAVAIYFQGERFDQGRRRLGNGVLSFHRDWLELPAKVVYPTPPEVGLWFKRIAAHLFSGIVVKAGVHRYHVCKGLIADPTSAECLPPFDFIPWNPDVLKARGIRHRDTR